MRAIAIGIVGAIIGALVGCGGGDARPASGSGSGDGSSVIPASPTRRQQGSAWATLEAELDKARAEVVRTEAELHDAKDALAALAAAPEADRRAAQDRLDAAIAAERAATASYDRWQERAMEFSIARPPEDRHDRSPSPRVLNANAPTTP